MEVEICFLPGVITPGIGYTDPPGLRTEQARSADIRIAGGDNPRLSDQPITRRPGGPIQELRQRTFVSIKHDHTRFIVQLLPNLLFQHSYGLSLVHSLKLTNATFAVQRWNHARGYALVKWDFGKSVAVIA